MNGVAFTAIQMEDVSGISIDRRRPQAELVSATVFTILDRNVLCSSATATPEGGPHINTAYFSYSEALDLYFLSHPASRHCRNLSIHSAMAMTVFYEGPPRTLRKVFGYTSSPGRNSLLRRG
jgi:hypothetical protein